MSTRLDSTATAPRVVLGSESPAKRRAVEEALKQLYGREITVTTTAAGSGVRAQPWGEEETRRGALNRARGALELDPEAQIALGIEAGVSEEPGWPLWTFAWIVALSRDGQRGAARSATFTVAGEGHDPGERPERPPGLLAHARFYAQRYLGLRVKLERPSSAVEGPATGFLLAPRLSAHAGTGGGGCHGDLAPVELLQGLLHRPALGGALGSEHHAGCCGG